MTRQLPSYAKLVGGCEVKLAKAEGEGLRRFDMLAYSGGEVSYFGSRVVFDVEGIQASNQSLPILREHDPNAIAGFSEKVTLKNNVSIEGRMSKVTAAAKEIGDLADEGFPWQASVGMGILRVERVEAGGSVKLNGQTFKGPLYVVRQSVLRESSFVPLGMDPNTRGAVLSAYQNGKEGIMPNDVDEDAPKKLSFDGLTITEFKAAAPKLYGTIREEVLREDRERVSKIGERINASGMPEAARASLHQQAATLSFEDAERIIEREEGVEASLTAARTGLKASGIEDAEIEKDLKALRADIAGLSRNAAQRQIETFVKARAVTQTRLVKDGDQVVIGKDSENKSEGEVKLAAAVKTAREDFKKLDGSIMGLAEKDFVAQRLDTLKLSFTESKLAELLK